jgi:phosphoesterase RecJ-like protein
MIDKVLLGTAGSQLSAAQRILVLTHARPDGDGIGSLLGLGLALQIAGKSVQMVLTDGIPASLRHLEGIAQVKNHPEGQVDYICVLDCSDVERVGNGLVKGLQPDLNIDHHATNLNYARLNLVDTQAVATAEMVAELLRTMEIPLTQPVASALLTGLITDTIGFRTYNMTPKAMRLAANLMEAGGNLSELYRRALVNRSYEAARFWGVGLNQLEREGRLIWTTLTIADRTASNYPGQDDADLANILSAIDGADIALIFMEQPDGRVKVSWRAQSGFDVSQIAMSFGGGGHPAAAGVELDGNLQQVQASVLAATRPLLNRNSTPLAKGN